VLSGSAIVRPAFAGALTEAPANDDVDMQRVVLNTQSKEIEICFEIMGFPSEMECSEVE